MILKCSGGQQQLKERVEARQRRGRDASEADERVLAMQLQDRDELGPDEEHVAIDAGEILE
jgi:predicted kinase